MVPVITRFLDLQPTVEGLLHRWLAHVPAHMRGPVGSALGDGRRFRPTLLAALVGDLHAHDQGARAAVAIELLHRASLIVDDVMDGDMQRRGSPAFAIEQGDDYAAVLPHFLVAEALHHLSAHSDLQQEALGAYRRMAVGQVADVRPPASGALLPFYQEYVLEKTRPLFEMIFRTAATCTEAVPVPVAARVGRRIGEVFQIANDLFDADPALQRTRGSKRFAVVNIDLLTALAVDAGEVPHHYVARLAGRRLAPDEMRGLMRRISSPRVLQSGRAFLARALETANREVQKLPSEWHSLVRETLEWTSTRAFWDHSEHEAAGYGSRPAVA